MASDYFPIFGSGLDQLADQRYRYGAMSYGNQNANIGRQAQAQEYWNQGVDRNAQAANQADAQDLQLQLQAQDRADRLAQAADANKRHAYEFGAQMDYSRGRDAITDALHQKQLEASVAGRAASIAQKNAELQASLHADAAEQAQATAQAAEQARKLNEFISSKRMDMTFKQRFPEIKTGSPDEARARRTVADMTPDLWAKLDEPTLKKTIDEFKLTSGLDGFEFDKNTQMLVPSAPPKRDVGMTPVMGRIHQVDDSYFGDPTSLANNPATITATSGSQMPEQVVTDPVAGVNYFNAQPTTTRGTVENPYFVSPKEFETVPKGAWYIEPGDYTKRQKGNPGVKLAVDKKLLTPDVARQYRRRYGSRKKAEEAARADGYAWNE